MKMHGYFGTSMIETRHNFRNLSYFWETKNAGESGSQLRRYIIYYVVSQKEDDGDRDGESRPWVFIRNEAVGL